ncbi:MAG: low-specificity L-threonine aldolase [Gammaproteobacteria bacterium]|nr:low-specificity L-threonine aldolase [Gammaproteobacteria bacterium]
MSYSVELDFRSDTVTQPCAEMREAMANAPVGDDVYGDDPTVLELEHYVAETLGKESALFVSSGTQSNLLAILSHCERGDEYICSQYAHLYKYEAGGAAVLGSVQPQPMLANADGTLDLDAAERLIKPDDMHFARTRLLCIENTIGGIPLPLEYEQQLRAFKQSTGLALHLDGARIANAAVYHGCSLKDLVEVFDSVSICLSKGLGAPIGSILVGRSDLIAKARRWRKMLGGGWRQAGVLAAAARIAFDRRDSLAQDHARAQELAERLSSLDFISVDQSLVKTNMVFAQIDCDHDALKAELSKHGISLSLGKPTRLVVHRHISQKSIDTLIAVLSTVK